MIVDVELWRGRCHAVEDLALVGPCWVADLEFEHETVDLSFGEGVMPSWSMGFSVARTRKGREA